MNPYQAFDPLPAKGTLTPALDRWTETDTCWTSPVTRRGRPYGVQRRLQYSSGAGRPTAYKDEIAPYVTVWEQERQRLEAEAAAAEAEYNSLPNAQACKRGEIRAGYDAALALEDFKAEDPEGWVCIRDIHTARRDQLLAAVEVVYAV